MLNAAEAAVTVGAVAAAAATSLWWYAAMAPESSLFGPQLVAGNNPKEAALTYDDGPNGDTTLRLLDVLAKHETKATFFLIGGFARQQPEIVRQLVAGGHVVGNHTVTHPVLTWQTTGRIEKELAECNAILEDITGMRPRFFRPPYGARRPVVMRIAQELGLKPVLWNTAGNDWTGLSADRILRRLQNGIRANQRRGQGSNLLLHDGGHLGLGQMRDASVEATDKLLQTANKDGIQFVTAEAWA